MVTQYLCFYMYNNFYFLISQKLLVNRRPFHFFPIFSKSSTKGFICQNKQKKNQQQLKKIKTEAVKENIFCFFRNFLKLKNKNKQQLKLQKVLNINMYLFILVKHIYLIFSKYPLFKEIYTKPKKKSSSFFLCILLESTSFYLSFLCFFFTIFIFLLMFVLQYALFTGNIVAKGIISLWQNMQHEVSFFLSKTL